LRKFIQNQTIKTLIIIPCYNEEAAIGALLDELLSIKDYPFDIVVINDCSTDNTAEIVAKYPVNLLSLSVNLGIGGAMQTGYRFAMLNDYDVAIQMDGDGQHPPDELKKIVDFYTKNHSNVVIGSRFIDKKGFQSSLMRRIGIAYFHWLIRFFTQQNIFDCTSGFRLFDKKAIQIAANYYPDEYPEPESLVIFAKRGLKINEVPVLMRERQGGTSSIKYFGTIYYMVKVSIAIFFSLIRKVN
jgi:glycosyltransferase involved in cell wall biosynthesis